MQTRAMIRSREIEAALGGDNVKFVCMSPGDFQFEWPDQDDIRNYFLCQHLSKHVNSGWILGSLQHTYLLIGDDGKWKHPSEQRNFDWKSILPADLMHEMDVYGRCVLGWVLIQPKENKNKTHIILIESRLKGFQIGTRLLEALRVKGFSHLEPFKMLPESLGFWKKMLERRMIESTGEYV